MSLSAAIIDALLANGVTVDQLAAAVKADIADREAIDLARREAKKEGNRTRQRRKRERDNPKSRDVTPVTRDKCDAPPNEDILTPRFPPIGISGEIPPPAEEPEIELQPEHVVEVWNDLAGRHGLPAVKKITPERRKKLRTFIRRHSIDDITEAITAIPRSPFLLGQNDRGWQASFDWFLEPRNFTKLSEGTYVH